MAVYKRGEVWWFKFTFAGEAIRESTKQGNKRIAEQIEAARKTQLAKGEVGIADRKPIPTLATFAPRFTAEIEVVCKDKPATVSFYKSKLRSLLANDKLASAPLDKIDEDLIAKYVQARSRSKAKKKPYAVATVNRELATLRRCLRLALAWKLITHVPQIKMLRGENQREFVLSYEQEPVYLEGINPALRTLATLLLDTGLRIGEALSLEWAEVRLKPVNQARYGYLTVRAGKSKNSKGRNVPLTRRVRELLERLLAEAGKPSGHVLRGHEGRPLYQTYLNQQHRAHCEALGFPREFVMHSLRHTFGTRLGESGADAFTIMKLMGHSSVTISQRYVHPSPESVERAFDRLETFNATGSTAVSRFEVGTKLGTVDLASQPQIE